MTNFRSETLDSNPKGVEEKIIPGIHALSSWRAQNEEALLLNASNGNVLGAAQ